MKLLDRLRRDRPPPDVTAALDSSDRLLSWAATTDGAFIVASRRGLRMPDARFVPWHRIDKAVWRGGVLRLTEAGEVEPGVMEALSPVTIALAEPRNLPSVVQTRVTQSVAHTSHRTLPDGRGAVRIVARRVTGQDGLEWSLRYESGADRHDADIRDAAEQLLADTKAATTPAE